MPLVFPSVGSRPKRREKPIAKEAGAFVCRNLGTIQDGQVHTDQALDEFAKMFTDQAAADTVRALRVLFKLTN
jgi:asparagine synthetase A